MLLLQRPQSARVSAFWQITLLGGVSWLAHAQSLTIKEYPLPSYPQGSAPGEITAGPDGALWFTEAYGNKIGRITTDGAITEYTVPTANSYPFGITVGGDGALWFTEIWANKIGRVTIAGSFTEYALPVHDPARYPYGITSGPDGALWYTLNTGHAARYGKIGRITLSGVITEYGGENSQFRPFHITNGPDGALWFTNDGFQDLGRITPGGVITFLTGGGGGAGHIITGPDGALWHTGACLHYPDNGYAVARVTTGGVVTRYWDDLKTCTQPPSNITIGPDGALWYTRVYDHSMGRVTTAGVLTFYNLPDRGYHSGPYGITAGPDGNIWFTEPNLNQIGVAILPNADTTKPVIVPDISGALGNNGWYRSNVLVSWNLSDPESGIASSTGCTPTTFTAETLGVNLTCSATNGAGLSNSVAITIKIDKTPPVISGMPSPGCTLWPPNHEMVEVGVVKATDTLSGLAPGSLKVTGASNESSGAKEPYLVIAPDGTGGFVVKLRAERSGNGRTYTLAATANDLAGNLAATTTTCTVPHDQSGR